MAGSHIDLNSGNEPCRIRTGMDVAGRGLLAIWHFSSRRAIVDMERAETESIMTEVDPAGQSVYAYDMSALPEAPLPLERGDIDADLKKELGKQNLSGYRIEGVAQRSPAELFLKNYIFHYSTPNWWGREFHAVLPIGRAEGGQSPPLGRVILRWTAAGYCTAALIGEGPVTAGDQGAAGQLAEALQKRFSLREITGRDRAWLDTEMRAVSRALLRIPQDDYQALNKVGLVRMPVVPEAEANTAAHFHRHQSYQGADITDVAEIRIGDKSFERDGKVFVGTRPDRLLPISCQLVLHEVGHAVETSRLRQAGTVQMIAARELDEAGRDLQGAGQSATPEQRTRYERAVTRSEQADALLARDKVKGRSVRLNRFVEYVTQRNINPGLTDYTGVNWAGHPQELFAESYSLWLLDPQFLSGFSNDLFTYFESGAYRNDA